MRRPWILALALTACGGGGPDVAAPSRAARGELAVIAEGPCARLSVQAMGARRLLVYGDTGYDLRGWVPGDAVAAAQAIAVLADGAPGFDPRLDEGLLRDPRGYVPGELRVGGADEANGWLLRIDARYAPGGHGALFERRAEGHRLGARGWERAEAGVVDRPRAAAALPPLPTDACGAGLRFVAQASTATPEGGLVIAGRCDDDAPQNLPHPVVVVLHGVANARAWRVERAPEMPELDGIVNLDLDARGDDDVLLVAWEPFLPAERRATFAAAWRGDAWRTLPPPVERPLLSVARQRDGTAFYATGRELFRVAPSGEAREVPLPLPHHARGAREDLLVQRVDVLDDELWVEAAYRVELGGGRDPVWASALYSDLTLGYRLHCDAREPAREALAVVSPGGDR